MTKHQVKALEKLRDHVMAGMKERREIAARQFRKCKDQENWFGCAIMEARIEHIQIELNELDRHFSDIIRGK